MSVNEAIHAVITAGHKKDCIYAFGEVEDAGYVIYKLDKRYHVCNRQTGKDVCAGNYGKAGAVITSRNSLVVCYRNDRVDFAGFLDKPVKDDPRRTERVTAGEKFDLIKRTKSMIAMYGQNLERAEQRLAAAKKEVAYCQDMASKYTAELEKLRREYGLGGDNYG